LGLVKQLYIFFGFIYLQFSAAIAAGAAVGVVSLHIIFTHIFAGLSFFQNKPVL